MNAMHRAALTSLYCLQGTPPPNLQCITALPHQGWYLRIDVVRNFDTMLPVDSKLYRLVRRESESFSAPEHEAVEAQQTDEADQRLHQPHRAPPQQPHRPRGLPRLALLLQGGRRRHPRDRAAEPDQPHQDLENPHHLPLQNAEHQCSIRNCISMCQPHVEPCIHILASTFEFVDMQQPRLQSSVTW